MFFWGGYSFQLPQQQERADKPPLRFPVYTPPPPQYIQALSQRQGHEKGDEQQQQQQLLTHAASAPPGNGDADSTDALLRGIGSTPLPIHMAACGLKHAVVVLRHNAPETSATDDTGSGSVRGGGGPPRTALYGIGSNHSGQLGHRVGTYTTTLTDLHPSHDIFDGDVVSVACGTRHTLLATDRGCVYACGDGSWGQLGLPPATLAALAKGARGRGGLDDGPDGAAGAGVRPDGVAVPRLTQVASLVHIVKVFANNNASFALDARGCVYSWGDAQYGHLGHGDHIVADEKGGLDRVENVRVPRQIRWFDSRRVTISDVAVGKSHVLFMSTDGEDVYSCGEGHFGKLGHGSIDSELEPRRLESFPERKQKERVVAIAAGDDCSLVLKHNPIIGSVVYFFGKLSNGDGQLTPTIVAINYAPAPVPLSLQQQQQRQQQAEEEEEVVGGGGGVGAGQDTYMALPLRAVYCGRGSQCAVLSEDGRLFVWGKHSYVKLYNGTNADAARGRPTVVDALQRYVLGGAAIGGTFMIAWGSQLRYPSDEDPSSSSSSPRAAPAAVGKAEDGDSGEPDRKMPKLEEGSGAEGEDVVGGSGSPSSPHHGAAAVKTEEDSGAAGNRAGAHAGHAWDVVVPHDSRVNVRGEDDADGAYEEAVSAYLTQYFGFGQQELARRYIAGMPAAPARTAKAVFAYDKIPTAALTVGQKVRLWLTDLYALATITKVDAVDADNLAAAAAAPPPPSQRRRSSTPARSQDAAAAARASQTRDGGERSANEEEDIGSKGKAEAHAGRRVLLNWERDDWRDEVVTLFTDDETLDSENDNRWQPFWFEKTAEGEFVIAKSR